jgi:hypothetical protein
MRAGARQRPLPCRPPDLRHRTLGRSGPPATAGCCLPPALWVCPGGGGLLTSHRRHYGIRGSIRGRGLGGACARRLAAATLCSGGRLYLMLQSMRNRHRGTASAPRAGTWAARGGRRGDSCGCWPPRPASSPLPGGAALPTRSFLLAPIASRSLCRRRWLLVVCVQTTIMATAFAGGVVLGADSRTSTGGTFAPRARASACPPRAPAWQALAPCSVCPNACAQWRCGALPPPAPSVVDSRLFCLCGGGVTARGLNLCRLLRRQQVRPSLPSCPAQRVQLAPPKCRFLVGWVALGRFFALVPVRPPRTRTYLAPPSPSPVLACRASDKLTELSDRVYCCRSGSAADTQAVADIVRRHLTEHKCVRAWASVCCRKCALPWVRASVVARGPLQGWVGVVPA